MKRMSSWVPALLLTAGAILTVSVDGQRRMSLREPLGDAVSEEVLGMDGRDEVISEEEIRVAGPTDYLYRIYDPGEASKASAVSLYVGYYANQTQGKTIHSPKNCLPGAGWEALTSSTAVIATASGAATVNQYVIQRKDQRALVLYWYQGRGRIASNEYAVKFDLLRDSALRGRSDEALVRVVVPFTGDMQQALDRGVAFAGEVADQLNAALPA